MIAQPFRLDALIVHGAQATKRAVPGAQKRYCRVMHVTKSTASRHLRGDRHAPSTHFLLQIARAEKASGYPLISEAIATVNQAQIEHAPLDELYARLHELNELEHDAQADEDRQTLRASSNPTAAQFEAAATADIREAELGLERAAILRELAHRLRRAS